MPSETLPPCPFLAGSMITDPQFFVGRKAELEVILSRMTATQPTSINLVGKRFIGKSSLLYHFCQTYQQRVSHPSHYIAIYLSLQETVCQRQTGFYQAVAWLLKNHPAVWGQSALTDPLKVKPFNRLAFSAALGQWKRQGVLPVLCLDEFEYMFWYPEEFDDSFFDNLRSLINSHVLMLVVASHRKLNFYGQRYQFNSAFFHFFSEVLNLGEFTEQEAKELVCLPAITTGEPPGLTQIEQHLAREWGGHHPYLLQLAGELLWEARQRKKQTEWAQELFKQEARQVPKPLWKLTLNLSYFMIGAGVLILLFILVVLGLFYHSQIWQMWQWLQQIIVK